MNAAIAMLLGSIVRPPLLHKPTLLLDTARMPDNEGVSAGEQTEVVRAEVIPDVIEHRIGGRAGVRVQHSVQMTEVKRVNSHNDVSELGELRPVPRAVLAEARRVLADTELGPGDARLQVIELLGPWLD